MNVNGQANNSAYVSPLLHLDWSPSAVPINGYLMPLIAVATTVNNALVFAVLMHRQIRSPTNVLLAALAVSDTLTIVCPVPCFVHFYTVGQRYLDWVPYCNICYCQDNIVSASSRNLKVSVLYLPGTSYSTLGGVLSVMVIVVDRCDGPRRLGDS